jgi:hypothetical protein
MDDADLSQQRMERELELAMMARKRQPEMPPTGSCYNCGEAVIADARWCDNACRDDWEKREKNRP